jgi:hypothetical protein
MCDVCLGHTHMPNQFPRWCKASSGVSSKADHDLERNCGGTRRGERENGDK